MRLRSLALVVRALLVCASLVCAPLAWLGCGPEFEPAPCERLSVRVEVPTATPYWANLTQGDFSEWFECRPSDAAEPSDSIEVDEHFSFASIHTCGAEGFEASLFEPGVVTVHLIYVDRFWVTRALEVKSLSSVAMPEDEACPAEEPIEHVVENRVFGTECAGDEPTGAGCSTVAPVCDQDGNWYRSECALRDTGPMGACPIFPGEVCRP